MISFGKFVLFLLLVYNVIGENKDMQCSTVKATLSNIVEFNCIGLTALFPHTKNAPKNTTSITIFNAKITKIPRRGFTDFGATLEILDLQRGNIDTIEADGFSDLYFLKKLILSENKLTRITGESFRNLYRLQHLDISFNNIAYIDTAFYQPQRFPVLANFYFDYNQLESIDYSLFPLLYSLRKVKFGRNPWKWGYRLLLTQQLDNIRVDYRDDWEEWGWMSNAVRECEDNGKGKAPDDILLDCVILKLLQMDVGNEHTVLTVGPVNVTSDSLCLTEASQLINCNIQASSAGEAVRRSFEGLISTLKDLGPASAKVPAVAIH